MIERIEVMCKKCKASTIYLSKWPKRMSNKEIVDGGFIRDVECECKEKSSDVKEYKVIQR